MMVAKLRAPMASSRRWARVTLGPPEVGAEARSRRAKDRSTQLGFVSAAAVAAQRAQMQARFLAWLGMRSSAAPSISALKHQHSLLPWLSPQAFGSPQIGHLFGSTSLAIGKPQASTEGRSFRAAQSSGSDS